VHGLALVSDDVLGLPEISFARESGSPSPGGARQPEEPGDASGRMNDENGFEKVYISHFGMVFHFFCKKVPSREVAEELTQDVFLKAFDNFDRFKGKNPGSATAWIKQIMKNTLLNYYRDTSAAKRSGETVSYSDEIAGKGLGPESVTEDLDRQQRRETLIRAIDTLPGRMRQVCLLKYLHARDNEFIAGLLSISVDTVRSQLTQARKRLKQTLGRDGEEL
jgi:RNA polymerase sigma-70 factor (ECF subfamily)